MKSLSIAASVAFLSTLFVLAGCDQKPAKTSEASTATPAAAPDEADKAAAILKGDAGAKAAAGAKLPTGHPGMNTPAQPAAPSASKLPPGHPPMGAAGKMPAAPAMPAGHPPTGTTAGKTLSYEVPSAWKSQPTTGSAMRKARFVLPAPQEGGGDGEMILYYFGPTGGGPVADNIARWRAMFVDEDGKPVGDDAVKQETIEVNGLKVTTLDVQGNYRASVMPGVAPAEPEQAARRLLAAIVETPGGRFFLKGVGPAATMEAHRKSFDEFIKSLKY